MLEQLRATLVSNARYLAVGALGFALAGGGATTVALVDDETPSPSATAEEKKADAAEKAAEAKEETEETEEAGEGARPTDTHGYCVSQAVAAAHAAGKTGRDVAAAAHSCPKPKAAEKAAKAKAKAARKAAAKTAEKAATP